ncbi:MAG: succinyldiaminopimelate transaminase [Gammaproteobacteria bacterium]|nr:succinyldiaminopimelate transaminase [Gammaproteobacteria bacterium]
MDPNLNKLQPYPFEKLRALFSKGTQNSGLENINLSIGEPKSPTPVFIKEAMSNNLNYLANYPKTKGELLLRTAITDWLLNRFSLPKNSINPEQHILPVNGTREALFAIAQTVIDRSQNAKVLLPNPFYQIYEGAAYLAGAEPVYIDFTVINGEVPGINQVSEQTWQQTQLLYICTPSNPTGDIIPLTTLQKLLNLAHLHDFVICSDECYSEIYMDENNPPQGLLKACVANGDDCYRRCLAFYSLSKRSNSPGLRSGFVVGDTNIIAQFLKYRTYHGCAMPISTQLASAAAWGDETHVQTNRARYQQSFNYAIEEISREIEVKQPHAGFYLWLPTPIDDEQFALGLYSQQNVTVLPGKYLARSVNNQNPGTNRVRIALVATPEECKTAAQRITTYIKSIC